MNRYNKTFSINVLFISLIYLNECHRIKYLYMRYLNIDISKPFVFIIDVFLVIDITENNKKFLSIYKYIL